MSMTPAIQPALTAPFPLGTFRQHRTGRLFVTRLHIYHALQGSPGRQVITHTFGLGKRPISAHLGSYLRNSDRMI